MRRLVSPARILARTLALLTIGVMAAAPAPAQPAPDPFALPDPGLLDWRVSQRYALFQTLPDPQAAFERYALAPGETARDWHARLWARDGAAGFASPWAAALAADSRDALPWDAATELHRPKALEVLRNEANPDYRIAITLAYPAPGTCIWQLDGVEGPAVPCDQPHAREIPITGATLELRFEGAIGAMTTRIVPHHRVVLGLGDSFGSGEGNPDLPALWDSDWDYQADGSVGRTTWLKHMNPLVLDRPARWLDERCHRSFFSQQSLIALRLASQDPHGIVTFLHYACTGAEILDGVLLPQVGPGRVPRTPEKMNRFAQVNAAIIELCRDNPNPYAPAPAAMIGNQELTVLHRRGGFDRPGLLDRGEPSNFAVGDPFDTLTRRARNARGGDTSPRGLMLSCPQGKLRAPDQVLLSIGGNDIGFGNLIQYFLAPLETGVDRAILPDFCPDPLWRYDGSNASAARHCAARDSAMGYHSGDLVGSWDSDTGIGARYRLLLRALDVLLETPPARVAMAQYPDPLRAGSPPPPGPDAQACAPLTPGASSTPGAVPGYDPLSPFNALKSFDPSDLTAQWELDLTAFEAQLTLGQIEALRSQIATMAQATGIVLACRGRDAFLGHGWWRGTRLNLPTHGSPAARWHPSDWQPYAFSPSDRAVRTANDSFLTQMTASGDVHGIFHPNLIGHTLLADALWTRLVEAGRAPDLAGSD